MSAVVAVALADVRQRTRTFTTLLIVAFALQIGYLFVPDASASYVTVDMGGWRGIYDSNWMGAATALMIVTLFPLAGFFLVRPAMTRDASLGTLDLVLAAPLSRASIVLGKWLSNIAVLAGVAGVTMLAAIVMQLVRSENRTIDLTAYLLPYLIVVLPACAVTAACAVVFSTIPGMGGILGGVVWFFVWTAMLVIPIGQTEGTRMVAAEPFGLTAITSSLFASLQAHVGNAVTIKRDLDIGFSTSAGIKTYPFTGIAWTPALLLYRAVWTALAALACVAISPLAFRTRPRAPRPRAAVLTRIVGALPLPRLLHAELLQGVGLAGPWWAIGVVALTVGALFATGEASARGVAPLAWVWPIGPIAALSVADVRAGLGGVLLATPTAAWRRVVARWLAAFCLAALPIAALAVHAGPAGVSLLAIAAAVAAVGIALGTIARAAAAFEGLALIAWYLGPVNRLPELDPSQAIHAPVAASLTAAAVTLTALAIATYRAGARLDSAKS
jgi:ABC-type transport system involved in multi-copper enzyme maturation permease subunit